MLANRDPGREQPEMNRPRPLAGVVNIVAVDPDQHGLTADLEPFEVARTGREFLFQWAPDQDRRQIGK